MLLDALCCTFSPGGNEQSGCVITTKNNEKRVFIQCKSNVVTQECNMQVKEMNECNGLYTQMKSFTD